MALPRRTLLQLGLAIVAISTAAPLVQAAAPAPAISVAALRVAIAAAVLLLLAAPTLGPALRRLPRRELGLLGLSGLLLGAHFGVWIASLGLTSTAASVALVATNPIFAALFGLLLGDRVAPREWLGIAVAVAGCAVLAGGDWSAGGDAVLGDALALLGAALAAGSLVLGRRLRAALPLLPYLASINAVAASGLLVVAAAIDAPLLSLPVPSYAAIAAAALVASLGGHSLLAAAARRAPAHLVALAILGEPIGASLLTWACFGDAPPVLAVVGGGIALAGIAAGFTGRTR